MTDPNKEIIGSILIWADELERQILSRQDKLLVELIIKKLEKINGK